MNLLLHKKSKILVRGVDTVGTFVLATPFYRELRKNFPDAYITVCVKPLVYDLVKNCPYVNEVILYDAKTIFQKYRFIKKLKNGNYDLALILSGSFKSALSCYLAGIRTRIGYPHDHRGFLLTHPVKEFEKKHCVEYLLYILRDIGAKIDSVDLELWLPENSFSISEKIFNEYGITKSDIVIGIGFGVAGEKARGWPTKNWIKLIRLLLNKNIKVILFGTKNDLTGSAEIEKNIDNKNLVNLTGKTSLIEFANCVGKCFIYVSVDTGGIHIASALGVKTVGLYVPGSDICWGPRGEKVKIISKPTKCAPCNQHKMRRCKDNICMKSITVNEVYNVINSAFLQR